MASDEEAKPVTAEDMKGVVELPPSEGGNFVSSKKVTLFDDEFRFVEHGNRVPMYYLQSELIAAFHDIVKAKAKVNPDVNSTDPNSVSRLWWDYYRSRTEDEVRSALGIIWRIYVLAHPKDHT